jgi:carboxypeptidase C (cathepsin A)
MVVQAVALDQPAGVGFIYADCGEHVGTTEGAALDIAAFVALFFQTFANIKGRVFHLASKSYGGRYPPVFARAIIRGWFHRAWNRSISNDLKWFH